jgi:hypothetical protein
MGGFGDPDAIVLLYVGERGIIATFFADMHMWASNDDWLSLLGSVVVRDPKFPRSLDSISVIVEPNFGPKGFGQPDAVLMLETNNERFVIITEAKRVQFERCRTKDRGEEHYNSTLKGQLELNYILSVALSVYQCDDCGGVLTEPTWITRTPYMLGRKQPGPKILKNQVLLRSVVSKLSYLPIDNYYHLVITTDAENPFDNPRCSAKFPEIYQAAVPDQNLWNTAQSKFAWLNYERLLAVAKNLDRFRAPMHAGLFEESYSLNLANMQKIRKPTTGSHTKKSLLVYAPAINSGTFLHCSYQGETCKLRDYTTSSSDVPRPDKRFTRDEVLGKATERRVAKPVPYTDVQFWHDEIRRINACHLPPA